ncbi:MAG: hypothetical protein MJZ01_05105 [Bacteroidales bacterium]|nr:hypothetical protein [Bacteroidales bacterium]
MKKEAIIDIISNDLKEMLTLLDNFKDDDGIAAEFIELLDTKHQNIGREIALLDFWKKESVHTAPAEQPIKPVIVPEDVVVEQPKVEEAPVIIEQVPQPEPEPVESIVEPKIELEENKAEIEEAPVAKDELKTEPQPEPKTVVSPMQKEVKTAAKASDVKNYGTPVDNIKKAIGIADRFLYKKELFGGDEAKMNNAIDAANEMQTYDDAERFFISTFGWDAEDKTVAAFLKAVHRKFI